MKRVTFFEKKKDTFNFRKTVEKHNHHHLKNIEYLTSGY